MLKYIKCLFTSLIEAIAEARKYKASRFLDRKL